MPRRKRILSPFYGIEVPFRLNGVLFKSPSAWYWIELGAQIA